MGHMGHLLWPLIPIGSNCSVLGNKEPWIGFRDRDGNDAFIWINEERIGETGFDNWADGNKAIVMFLKAIFFIFPFFIPFPLFYQIHVRLQKIKFCPREIHTRRVH